LLDSRTKLLLTALMTILVFIIDTLPVAAIQMLLFITLCRYAAGIPLKKIFPHVKLLAFLIALVIALQVLFGSGLIAGLMISCRVIALLVLMPMLSMTTGAQALAYGITRLGFNYRTAFIITSTLNLIPSFEEEARLIMEVRKLRGMKSVRFREYPAITLPLMIKAMRKAQLVSLAMDSRAFGAYKTRTWKHETRMSVRDYMAFAAGAAWFAAAVTANILIKR